jgi:hypothetical protein
MKGLLLRDDKFSLKEITRQLKLENVVGDRVFVSFEFINVTSPVNSAFHVQIVMFGVERA